MPVIFDSSVYISTLRLGRGGALLLQRWAQGSPLWLSSVVLQELYAGTSSNDYRALENWSAISRERSGYSYQI